MKKNNQNQKVIPSNYKFKLSNSPHAYIISVHIRNLMYTYGEEYVREVMRTLFLAEDSNKKAKKASGEEL